MTVPRLKLGRNYGIVYLISTAFDENDFAVKKLKSRITTNNFTNENYSKGSTLTGQNITKQKRRKFGANGNLYLFGRSTCWILLDYDNFRCTRIFTFTIK